MCLQSYYIAGSNRSSSNSSSIPHTRPDSLPHYSSSTTTTSPSGLQNNTDIAGGMMPSTGGFGAGSGGMSASFSAPNSLNNAGEIISNHSSNV